MQLAEDLCEVRRGASAIVLRRLALREPGEVALIEVGIFPIPALLDSKGRASLPVSLVGTDPRYIGSLLVAQTVTFDAKLNPTLTAPVISVVLW